MNHIEIADFASVHEADEQAREIPKPCRRKLAPCFHCGKQLCGCNVTKMVNSNDMLIRGFHKLCASELAREEPETWTKL